MQKVNIGYSVVIRTLGNAGAKYQATLDAIITQTVKPEEIIVVIPESYPLPKEKIGIERYIRSQKGMVIQRAVGIKGNKSDFILLLDDDVTFEPEFVEKMHQTLLETNSNIVIPIVKNIDGSFVMFEKYDSDKCRCSFNNIKQKISSWLVGVRQLRNNLGSYCMKISSTGGYLVNCKLDYEKQYYTQTGSGAVCFGESDSFLELKLEEEIWLDKADFAIPEDQVLFYKLYLQGNKIALNQKVNFIHLDAGSGRPNVEKNEKVLFSMERNGIIFWHRFIYSNRSSINDRLVSELNLTKRIISMLIVGFFFKLTKNDNKFLNIYFKAYKDAFNFLKSSDYKKIPKVK